MNKKKKIILASVIGVVAVVAIVAAILLIPKNNGGGQQGGAQTNGGDETGTKVNYSVSVKTVGGLAMSDVDVYVYADSSLADLKDYTTTDANGVATLSLVENANYAIALSGIPKGYDVADSYSFNGTTAVITLNSALISDEDISTATLGVGDVMYDFTVISAEGETITLSEVLAEKDMVMLNFWYTTCAYCIEEFPYMNEAYQTYQEDIEVIALNPLDGAAAVQSFYQSNGFAFIMADCPTSWANVFSVSGYPTSIFIDRYGVICCIEAGGMPSLRPFVSAFEHFTGDDYEQKICTNGISDLITQIKPTATMDTSVNISAAINAEGVNVTYRPYTEEQGDDWEYAWPFIVGEKNGESCIYASNQQIEESFAVIYADFELEAGQAIAFDYIVSSEKYNDVLAVYVDNKEIYQISGVDEVEAWKTCYPYVANEAGTYELAFYYMKDDSTNEGDDTAYIKNVRIVDEADIDVATYIPRDAATTEDGFEYNYATIVLSEKDGYYHVGNVDGPLLLVDFMGYTPFCEDDTVFNMLYEEEVMVDGENYYDVIVDYLSLASNSAISGMCTVNAELAEMLKVIAEVAGFDEEDENEWLKMCKYYQVYGTDKQIADPIGGLKPFSAFEATLGKDVATNYLYYDRAIIPRGLLAEFVPTKSGVYRFTSKSDYTEGIDAWIFDADGEIIYTYEHDERMYADENNASMVYYMEAGTPYYINFAFWDIYATGYIYYDVEYIAASYDLFRLASPGYFTYDTDATGEAMYDVIAGGIDVILKDGKYYEDLGKDASGKQLYGSLIYADFLGATPITSVTLKNAVDIGGFDFTKTENDLYILSILKDNDNDVEAAKEYLKTYWGEDYDANMEIYQAEDVFEGIYHGIGEDLTEEVRGYLDDIIGGSAENQGCMVVTERLAEILQMFMDKYTFEDVENSWLKLCYYYDTLDSVEN